MPENEFEKKVSSEMHELKFKPSEQVWEKVEERIRKKKDRRIFIIIFLFAGLALLGYWQRGNLFGERKHEIVKTETSQSDNNRQSNQKETEIKKTVQSEINDPRSRLGDEEKGADSNQQKELVDKNIDTKGAETDASLATNTKKERTSVRDDKIRQDKFREQLKRSNQSPVTKNQKPLVLVAASDDNKPMVKASDEKEIRQEQIKQEGTEVKPAEKKIDSIKVEVVEQKTNEEPGNDSTAKKATVKDSVAAAVQKISAQQKWKWGLQFTPGISSLNDQNFSFGTAKAADMAYQSPVSVSGAPARQPAPPSEHNAGFAFKLGGFMQGQISKKSQMVFGLQYAYYSEKITVGNKVSNANQSVSYTSLNSSYVAATPYQKVTNGYHFIEATAVYQLRLNKNQAKPFTWNVGLNLGQLIATNAVMYDTASGGVYYKNTDYLNKTQFSLLTGFSWALMNNHRMQWTLGPTIDIHLNSLLDNPFENRKYLFFAGLRLAVILNAKK